MQLKSWMEDLLSPSPFSWSWLTAAELGQRERGISLFWAARGFLRGGIPIFLTVGLSGDRAGSQWCNGKSEALGSKSDTTEQEEFTRRGRKRLICPNFSLIGEQLEHYSYSCPYFYKEQTQTKFLEMSEMIPYPRLTLFLEKLIFPLFRGSRLESGAEGFYGRSQTLRLGVTGRRHFAPALALCTASRIPCWVSFFPQLSTIIPKQHPIASSALVSQATCQFCTKMTIFVKLLASSTLIPAVLLYM